MSDIQQATQEFSKIRAFFWPVHRHEVRQLCPMFVLFFLISSVYHILRCLKVTLIIKAPGSGAHIIPFIKVWMVLPATIGFTFIYSYLASRTSRAATLRWMIGLFVAFFAIFLCLLYPNQAALTPSWLTQLLSAHLSSGYAGFIQLFQNWPIALFYVMAEMWSIIVIAILFWGFANEITAVDQAKRFYALIALGANCAGIFAGQLTHHLTLQHKLTWLPIGNTAWDQTVAILLSIVLLSALAIMGLFRHIHQQVPSAVTPAPHSPPQSSAKFNLADSFQYLLSSRYAACLALLVVAYHIVANMSDIIWTHQLNLRFPEPAALNRYLAQLDTLIGCLSVIIALCVFSNVIRRTGWTRTALITPAVWLVTCVCLFLALGYENLHSLTQTGLWFHLPLNDVIIFLGTLQMGLGKACKYTLFDQTKEIAFIPLSIEKQRKGKVIIDGIASRFGKSGGSILFQILLISFGGEITRVLPIAALIILLAVLLWIYAVTQLGESFHAQQAPSADDPGLDSNLSGSTAASSV